VKRQRARNEPFPRPHDLRRIDGARYRLTHIGFQDNGVGRELHLTYYEERAYLAAMTIPQPPPWRRAVQRIRRRKVTPPASPG
jgi:hypothetical protein